VSRLYGRLTADSGPYGDSRYGIHNQDKTKRARQQITASVNNFTDSYELRLFDTGHVVMYHYRLTFDGTRETGRVLYSVLDVSGHLAELERGDDG